MRQTDQQEQGAAPATPRARKDWEPFWRIIAGLMVIVIAWVIWVLYQITPRSVVTPLAYASGARSVGARQEPASATSADASPPVSPAPRVQPGAPEPPVMQGAAETATADLAMARAQAAARAGAHPSSADVQATALQRAQEEMPEKEQVTKGGLKLSTEIRTPLTEGNSRKRESEPDGTLAPAVSGKVRP